MDTEDGFAMLAQGIEAGIAQFQAQLVFALRPETPVAFEAGGKSRALAQFASVNFGMNFQRDHETLPQNVDGTPGTTIVELCRLNIKDLKRLLLLRCVNLRT